jgi:trans-aconitate methyltransferase
MKSPSKSQMASRADTHMDFIDFGCGQGKSMGFANTVLSGKGYGIDLSKEAIATCSAKGFDARLGNILDFNEKNAATATFSIDVFPELSNRNELDVAFLRAVNACRNFSLIQHQYFDGDSELALKGQHIKANFGKNIRLKPTVADYIYLTRRYVEILNIVGLAIFANGAAEPSPIGMSEEEEDAPSVPKSLRVVVGRKEVSRFRGALTKVATGKSLFIWEQA